MTISSFKVPPKFVEMMDQLVQQEVYTSRAEVIKTAIKEYCELFSSVSTTDRKPSRKVPSKSIESFLDH